MTRRRVLLAPTARTPGAVRVLIERGRSLGFTGFIAPRGVAIAPRRGEEWFLRNVGGFRPAIPIEGGEILPLVEVGTPGALERALAMGAERGGIAIRWSGARLIPLETAVLRSARRFDVWVVTRRVEEVPGALGALERGADRVILEYSTAEQLAHLDRLLGPAPVAGARWTSAVVERVEPVGVSERVIVDTTSLLSPVEGLLLGSSAGLLFHVASEAVGSEFTRPRPFRVNAGSPHLYVLMADGTTRYLSELEPGDLVEVTVPRGKGRRVRVGRLKIERRPMTMIRARTARQRGTVFVQEAETVRLTSDQGPVAVTEIRPGHKLSVVRLPPARHLGLSVDESIEER